ncbi:MAG: glycerophosphodiester phosphodiesterase [Solirubrobacteraceae bacterium]
MNASPGLPRGPGAPALIVAHRGAWETAPQNSLAAFARAIELGCDMVELDVRRTRDGCLVSVHDSRVKGTPIGALDYPEIRRYLGGGQPPLLEDVLELIAGRIQADIELKEAGYEEQAMTLIRQRLSPRSYVVTSFLDGVLESARACSPDVRRGLLLRAGSVWVRSGGAKGDVLEGRVRRTGAGFLAPHVSLIRAGILSWSAERELPSFLWTVNDQRRLRSLLADPRVEAVITDRPATALAIRAGSRSAQ